MSFAHILVFLTCFLNIHNVNCFPNLRESNATYWAKRDAVMSEDSDFMLGSDITLTLNEEIVNQQLMNMKNMEITKSFSTLNFPPAIHFFKSKPDIELSGVFQFIKDMPKGSILHVHDQSLVSVNWIISNLTYWENLYMCTLNDSQLLFQWYNSTSTSCNWELVSEVRASYPSDQDFDNYLYDKLSLYTPIPEVKYPDINDVWEETETIFTAINGLLTYKKAWESYLYEAMQEFMEDNVSYFEFRGVLSLLYETDGTFLTAEETIGVYKEVVDKFVVENPSFFGAKYIYAPSRFVSEEEVYNYVDLVIRLKDLYPDFVLGFDLVGQEDLGTPLIAFINPLLLLGEQNPPIPVFYHAGETDWEGMPSDENICDALLLNATRIGHGYAISKHPKLLEIARQNDVPMEVSPLSNQVLMLVDDLRNHPAASLIAQSFPLVISSDDPGLWGALPSSHDMYEAFMGLGGAKVDLKFLKKLALNSINYTAMNSEDKSSLMDLWVEKWNSFISNEAAPMMSKSSWSDNADKLHHAIIDNEDEKITVQQIL